MSYNHVSSDANLSPAEPWDETTAQQIPLLLPHESQQPSVTQTPNPQKLWS